jgi:hypothetical protein
MGGPAPATEPSGAALAPAEGSSAGPATRPRALPATGAPALLPVVAAATVGAAAVLRRLSHSEVRMRAATGDSLRSLDISVVGEVTAVSPDGFTLTRWVPGCCSAEDALDVAVRLPGHRAAVGSWWEVEGQWVDGTGAGLGAVPTVLAASAVELDDPPHRREDLG